jgi:hypothetical protein
MSGQLPRAFAFRLDRPDEVQDLGLNHTVIRVERAGESALLAGYRGPSGLRLSLVDVSPQPRLSNVATLAGRFQQIGGSGAVRSGSGWLIALSTRRGSGPTDSDDPRPGLDFLSVDSRGQITAAGALDAHAAYVDNSYYGHHPAGYRCPASCNDWYQLTRPFFADRLFALVAGELAEIQVENGRIREVQRLDLAPPNR